jgi:hypothetical protein
VTRYQVIAIVLALAVAALLMLAHLVSKAEDDPHDRE